MTDRVVALVVLVLFASAPIQAGDVRNRPAGVVPFPESFRALDRAPSDAIPQPGWVVGRIWRQLVFNEWEEHSTFEQRRTHVLTCDQALNLDVYYPSVELPTADFQEGHRSFWRTVTEVATSCGRFRGRVDFGTDGRTLRDGMVNVYVGTRDQFAGNNFLAYTTRWFSTFTDGTFARWRYGEIVFNPDVEWAESEEDTSRHNFDKVFVHEMLHLLGFFHVSDPASLMNATYGQRADLEGIEVEHAQLAYEIGPGVQYPGFLRPTATEPGDLKGGVKDLVDEALDDLQDDSGGRQAAESVPALPVAGVLLLATLLGLLGRRRLRTG